MSSAKGKAVEKPKNLTPLYYALVLVVGIGIGWFFGYEHGLDQVIPVAVDKAEMPMVTTDSYGRSMGHPHYGHGHP